MKARAKVRRKEESPLCDPGSDLLQGGRDYYREGGITTGREGLLQGGRDYYREGGRARVVRGW